MLKQLVVKSVIALALLGTLLSSGSALKEHMSATKAVPSGRYLACGQVWLPPCT